MNIRFVKTVLATTVILVGPAFAAAQDRARIHIHVLGHPARHFGVGGHFDRRAGLGAKG